MGAGDNFRGCNDCGMKEEIGEEVGPPKLSKVDVAPAGVEEFFSAIFTDELPRKNPADMPTKKATAAKSASFIRGETDGRNSGGVEMLSIVIILVNGTEKFSALKKYQ